MGFDTYLEIGDQTAAMWRKQSSPLPRMLFRHDQLVVTAASEAGDDEFTYPVAVRFETTAEEALRTLDDSGLGWSASVAAYGETRITAFSGGLVMAREDTKPGASENASIEALRQFEALSPVHDLEALGRVLATQWQDPEAKGVLLFDDITYDAPIESIGTVAFGVHRVAADMEGVDEAAATRAAESWALLYRDAPLIAWPLLLVILLKHLPPEMPVSLVLTEDAYESAAVSTVEEGLAYGETYWEESSELLAAHARTLGRLFGVLAGFHNQLGREFWFARASDTLARLRSMTTENSTTTERGQMLESLVEALIRTEEPQLQVVEKNFRTREEEIDLVIANNLGDAFWAAQASPIIFAECKNTTEKPGVPELRVFESKMDDRGAIVRIGIFISVNGFAETFLTRLKQVQRATGVIFAISGDDLEVIINEKRRLTDWLRTDGLTRALGKS